MSTVLRLVRPSNVDTVLALKGLLQRAVAGEVAGLVLCYKTPNGADEVIFTGAYAAHPGMALTASMRLSWRLNQRQDEALGIA